MRTPVTFFLVWLLSACPVLCRATDEGCCAEHEVTSGTSNEDRAPPPSDDVASCICGGAIKAPSLRVHGHGSGVLLPTPDVFICAGRQAARSFIEQLARGVSCSGPGDWRGSRRVQALLQAFRC